MNEKRPPTFTQTGDNKVVPMPNLGKQASPEQVEAAMAARDPSFLLQLIHKNRSKGFEQLERKLESLQDRELLTDPKVEMVARDVQMALAALTKIVEAQNSLLEIIMSNNDKLGDAFDMGKAHSLSNSGHIQNLKEVLIKLNVLTEESLQQNWKENIVPQFEKLGLTRPHDGEQE